MGSVPDFPTFRTLRQAWDIVVIRAVVARKHAETIRTIEGATGGKTGKDNQRGESKGRGNIESSQVKSGRRQADGYREGKREAGGEDHGWSGC
ncbi:hypothetical protein [Mesorhizobium sp. M0323]|uniref:hypothetical protein n=1 Tax=Mesorhizobium sp. M0323 TaxID=2956938 RepID=UPI00333DD65E